MRQLLLAQPAYLQQLPLDLTQHGSNTDHIRADATCVAVEYLPPAINVLEIASKE